MAKALEYPVVFKALLNGGYICERINPCFDKRVYTVVAKDETQPAGNRRIGHITERQFDILQAENIICYDPQTNRTDKYDNIYHSYRLAIPAALTKEVQQ